MYLTYSHVEIPDAFPIVATPGLEMGILGENPHDLGWRPQKHRHVGEMIHFESRPFIRDHFR
jgi:hypothetical protein